MSDSGASISGAIVGVSRALEMKAMFEVLTSAVALKRLIRVRDMAGSCLILIGSSVLVLDCGVKSSLC
jgi:hypothetical protein